MEDAKKNKLKRVYNIVIASLGGAMLLYYISCGLSLNFSVSALWVWAVSGMYCLLKGILRVICIDKGIKPIKVLRVAGIIWLVFIYLFFAFFVVFEAVAIKTSLKKPEPELDYIIVLGAKVNGTEPSKSLSNRIRTAYDYLSEYPLTKAVLTGGKGDDEGISEALCMYNKLTEMGIDPGRLIIEDRSTSTMENMKFSKELISDEDCSIGVVSAGYHMFRALGLFEEYFERDAYAIVAYTDNLFWLPHYYVREFIAYVAGQLGLTDVLNNAPIKL